MAKVQYEVTLENGSKVKGITNSAGKTQRISTNSEQKIKKIEVIKNRIHGCQCHVEKLSQIENKELPRIEIPVDGAKTNSSNIGESIHKISITHNEKSRPLTSNEITMAKSMFRDSIDYSKVLVFSNEYLPFGLQPDNTAMTPNGNMYFNEEYYLEDFASSEFDSNKHWFMHEMVHVWQHQLGLNVILKGIIIHPASLWGLAYNPYEYSISSNNKLQDFNMEQQGDIIADYFSKKNNFTSQSSSGRRHKLDHYAECLKEFLENPKNEDLLP